MSATPIDGSGPGDRLPARSLKDVQVTRVLRESPRTLLVAIASAWLLTIVMLEGNPSRSYAFRAIGWAVLMTATLSRGIHISSARRDGKNDAVILKKLLRNGFIAAVAWGSASFFLIPDSDLNHQVILVASLGLIITAGAMGRAATMPVVQLYALIATATVSAGLLLTPGAIHRALGLGFLLFGLIVFLFSRAQSATLRRERRLSLKVEILLAEARAGRQRADSLLLEAQAAREEAEAARLLAENAEHAARRANASKTRFLATASHDLRQPLHSIGLLTGLLKLKLRESDHVDLLNKVEGSVQTMERLFVSLLDISKLDSGVIKASFEDVDVHSLFQRLQQTWLPQATDKKIALRMRPTAEVIRSDALLIEQILNNFLSNAIRYTERGGILLACRRRQDHCELEVWDTGIGIESADTSRIFDEFVRVGDSSSDGPGLGLGLSIVERTARILGHPVSVRTRRGRGSCFSLKATTVASRAHSRAIQKIGFTENSPVFGAFVVVVDDDASNRLALARVLHACGCHTLDARSWNDFLSQSDKYLRLPDLVIADYHMNGETGIDFIRQVRQFHDAIIPAIVVTAGASAEIRAAAAAVGAPVLEKPMSVPELTRTLRRALGNR